MIRDLECWDKCKTSGGEYSEVFLFKNLFVTLIVLNKINFFIIRRTLLFLFSIKCKTIEHNIFFIVLKNEVS